MSINKDNASHSCRLGHFLRLEQEEAVYHLDGLGLSKSFFSETFIVGPRRRSRPERGEWEGWRGGTQDVRVLLCK